MGFGESVESVSRRFGHPIALSTSEDVELRAFSTQGQNGVLDVVGASYVVRGDDEARVQPSVWTWLANGTSQHEAAVVHAVTHHISHRAEFRAGTQVPDSNETDRLHQTLVESPRTSSTVNAGRSSITVTFFTLDAWTYGSFELEAVIVTVAGPGWFATCPVGLRAE
jgi:hypothetical protein